MLKIKKSELIEVSLTSLTAWGISDKFNLSANDME
jgi:hypothetical protein